MTDEVIAALIGAGATVLAAVLAAAIVVFQVRKQARHSLEQSRETERLKLKLDVYREILRVCDTQGEAERDLSTKLRGLQWQLQAWLNPALWGGHKPRPDLTGPAAIDLNYKVSMDTADVIMLIEKWQIIDPRLLVFRSAMNVAMHDVRQAWEPFFAMAHRILPPNLEYPGGFLTDEPEKLAAVLPTIEPLLDALSVLTAYGADFQAEMQNLLLSELFQHRVPPREPIDPRYFAVTLAKHDELMKHFDSETGWGRQASEVMARTRQAVQNRQQPNEKPSGDSK